MVVGENYILYDVSWIVHIRIPVALVKFDSTVFNFGRDYFSMYI